MTEKTIKICGHELRMLYCAAAETGYESMSGKSSSIFIPYPKKENGVLVLNADGTPVVESKATLDDWIKLAVASVIAAYSRNGEEPPIKSGQILYEATSEEITLFITTVAKLRNEWYAVPSVVKMPDEQSAEYAN